MATKKYKVVVELDLEIEQDGEATLDPTQVLEQWREYSADDLLVGSELDECYDLNASVRLAIADIREVLPCVQRDR